MSEILKCTNCDRSNAFMDLWVAGEYVTITCSHCGCIQNFHPVDDLIKEDGKEELSSNTVGYVHWSYLSKDPVVHVLPDPYDLFYDRDCDECNNAVFDDNDDVIGCIRMIIPIINKVVCSNV